MLIIAATAYYITPIISYKTLSNFSENFIFSLYNNKLIIQQHYTDKKPNGNLEGNRNAEIELGYFKSKAENEDFIYLFVTKSRYFFIPKSDFKNAQEINTFKNIINSHKSIIERKIQRKLFWIK